jgi:hypothetical protein
MGVKTKVFGSYAWVFLEGLASFYDTFAKQHKHEKKLIEKMKCHMMVIMYTMGFLIPCVYCRRSYQAFTNVDLPDGINISKILESEDGAKKLIYILHNRVNTKLEKQELEKATSRAQKRNIKTQWDLKSISYPQALQTRFPEVTDKLFWHAFIGFLGFIMCDYRSDIQSLLVNFIQTLGYMFALDSDLSLISEAYNKSLGDIRLLCGRMENLPQRIDIVWSIQKYVFLVKNWTFSHTPKSFEDTCRKAIVTKCDEELTTSNI